MHNIENKCKNFKNASTFIFFAKSSLQNMIDSSVSMDCFCAIGHVLFAQKVLQGSTFFRYANKNSIGGNFSS